MSGNNPVTVTSRAGEWVLNPSGEASATKSNDSPNETSKSSASRTVKQHPKFFFDNILVSIQIEDTLFNVHKYQLAKSEVFSDMFKVPKPKGDEPEEGSSPEHPIMINGVAASDFTALLTVLYAGRFSSNQPTPDAPLIIPAFRLANMFNFSELREILLPLAEKNLDDVDKIVFAREFDIKEWLAPAHIRLCQREEPLSGDKARKLGIESVLIIWRMREQHQRPSVSSFTTSHRYCYSCAGMNYVDFEVKVGKFYCDRCGQDMTFGSGLCYTGSDEQGGVVIDNAAIEIGVEKWVKDGCTVKD